MSLSCIVVVRNVYVIKFQRRIAQTRPKNPIEQNMAQLNSRLYKKTRKNATKFRKMTRIRHCIWLTLSHTTCFCISDLRNQ